MRQQEESKKQLDIRRVNMIFDANIDAGDYKSFLAVLFFYHRGLEKPVFPTPSIHTL